MPRSSPFVIHLSVEEAHELKRRAAKYTTLKAIRSGGQGA